jgi:tetratricopeptide (TPR) repeat protein
LEPKTSAPDHLLAEGDVRRGRLLARLGAALFRLGEVDVALLEGGVREACAAGDPEAAAEIEGSLTRYLWMSGERDQAFAHLDDALELVAARAPSPAKAATLAAAAQFRMLASDYEQSIGFGRQALSMAEQLGLEQLRSTSLSDLGTSRASMGQVEEGLAALYEATDIAGAANAPYELVRAKNNLAAQLWQQGRLSEGTFVWDETREAATQYGQLTFVRWLRAVELTNAHALGRWDHALSSADAFIAEVEAGAPHYLAPQAYDVRAQVRLAREQTEAALADAKEAVALARRAKDPQILFRALASAAHVHAEMGARPVAEELAGEVLAAIASGQPLGYSVVDVHVLALDARRGRPRYRARGRPFVLAVGTLAPSRDRVRHRRPDQRRRDLRRDRRRHGGGLRAADRGSAAH